MYTKSLNLIFSFSLLLGVYLMLTSKSWFSAWVGLELNMLSFIPIMMLSSSSISHSEASLKYFLVQVMASMVLLQSSYLMFTLYLSVLFMMMSLTLKLGMAPLYFWLPLVCKDISWAMNFILLTIQKVGPFYLLSLFSEYKYTISLISVSSAIVGAVCGLNEMYTRKLLAFSSINHMGWILFSMETSSFVWMIYLVVYVMITSSVIFLLDKFEVDHINQMIYNYSAKLPIMIIFLSLGGLPPFLGFAPKWSVITSSVSTSPVILFILLMTSVVTLFFYMRVGLVTLLLNSYNFNQTKYQLLDKYSILFLFMNMTGGLLYMMVWSNQSFML